MVTILLSLVICAFEPHGYVFLFQRFDLAIILNRRPVLTVILVANVHRAAVWQATLKYERTEL